MKVAVNQVTLAGNLTADPKIRQTPTGKDVCSFRLAVNRPGEDNGTDFIWVKTWNGLAKACHSYLHGPDKEQGVKSSAVLVTGAISTSSKKNDDGSYTNYFEVNARTCTFLSPKDEKGVPGEPVTVEVSTEPPTDEDIPF